MRLCVLSIILASLIAAEPGIAAPPGTKSMSPVQAPAMPMNTMQPNAMQVNPLRPAIIFVPHFHSHFFRNWTNANPYMSLMTGYGANSYASAYSNPYSPMMSPYSMTSSYSLGGYGMSSYGISNYGSGNSAPSYSTQLNTANAYNPLSASDSLLTAYGLPAKGGVIAWPLAFRMIGPGKDQDLVKETDTAIRLTVEQAAAAGSVSPVILEGAAQNVVQLRRWLRNHREDMAEGTYVAGADFLRKVERALARVNGAGGGY